MDTRGEVSKPGRHVMQSLADEQHKDVAEMCRLVETCVSARIRAELQPWLSKFCSEDDRSFDNDESDMRSEGCVGSTISEVLQADRHELARLTESCSNSRLKFELRQVLERWDLQIAESTSLEGAEADLQEMMQLVARCQSQRIKCAIHPWTSQLTRRLQGGQMATHGVHHSQGFGPAGKTNLDSGSDDRHREPCGVPVVASVGALKTPASANAGGAEYASVETAGTPVAAPVRAARTQPKLQENQADEECWRYDLPDSLDEKAQLKATEEDVTRMEYQIFGPVAKEMEMIRQMPNCPERRRYRDELAQRMVQGMIRNGNADEDD